MPGELDDLPEMPSIDMGAAVAEIGEGLGFEVDDTPPADPKPTLGDGETVNEEVAAPASEPTADAATTPPADPAAATDPLATPPRTWRPEAAADWAKLTPTARAEILKREEDMFKGLEGYKADAAFAKDVKGALAQYLPLLQQHNINPVAQIRGLMDAHYTLAFGAPEQKADLFAKLAQDYGINLAELAVHQPPYRDPEVERLTKEVQGLKSTLTAEQERQAAEHRSKVQREVDAFAADPKNVHFAAVANDIAQMLQSGVASTLQEAYDKAVWANPVTRQAEIARQQAEATKKAQAEAAAKAEAARKATAANVRTSAKSGSAATPLGSIDDTLNETYRSIMSRG